MTVYDVLKKAEPSQRMRITDEVRGDVLKKAEPSQRMRIIDEVRGSVSGNVFSLREMLGGAIMSLEVDIIRAEDGVIVVEVKSE